MVRACRYRTRYRNRVYWALAMAGCLVGFNASAAAQERAVLNMTVVIPGDLGPERMPQATITVRRSSDERTVASVSTDSSGTAALTLSVGVYYVTASAPGFQESHSL
jgi:Carboxypeptidase regulatory-like domain